MERKPLFKHAQIVRLPRLLDMLYKPAEIADELNVSPDTVYRSYLPAGAPHERDEKGLIWVHGTTFRQWAKDLIAKKKKKRVPLPEGKAWCVRCKKPVDLINPKPKVVNRYLEILQASCPHCKGIVNRARSRQSVSILESSIQKNPRKSNRAR